MRRFLLFAFLILLLTAGGAALYGNNLWRGVHESYKGYEGEEQFVEIPRGANSAEIGRRLVETQVVRDERLFRVALWWTRQGRSLKAGEYRFDKPLSPIDVANVLGTGSVYARRVTFPEGLNVREMATIFERAGFGPAATFVNAAKDASPINDLDPQATDLEGYLFPDTYALPRETSVTRLVAMMIARFRSAYTEDMRHDAQALGLTTRQVVTLASLVEKETGAPGERPLVAAVYSNRLKLGMPLQADPTVIYALERTGKYDGNIRREDLTLDSSYNTYRYPGLPPGPIASPGRASLEAAVAPASARYLYFVSRNDGSHVFAATLEEHNANVRKYQVEYFRQQRAETRTDSRNGR
jgi:UPF0755 protein